MSPRCAPRGSPAPLRALAVALLLLVACAAPRGSYVATATPRGPYIDATLVLSSGDWRFLFPRSDACAAVLRPEAPVAYSSAGSFGRVTGAGGQVCEALGAGSLRRWRRSRPEGAMAPSSPARWSILHEDPQVLLLRGRFPVASFVGLANTLDAVAMVPNDDVCGPVARSGEATLVFRTAGTPVLALGRCPLLGVASPP